ncbi:MAG: hypothetical protein UT69_C0033G0002 [Candidatus Yanofskybacteria bacterium GW2011_GWE1_40_10]|nr:MAG: hypothetical protein UT69_C0033G0002 [Candidatus Yanofskybacteria bacterium GW2011_GWE1_40_10]
MATTTGGERCEFCWRPISVSGHNDGCPILVGTPLAMVEWESGWREGSGDNYLRAYQLRYHAPSWRLGYRAGKAEIDRLVEEAIDRNYNYRECD